MNDDERGILEQIRDLQREHLDLQREHLAEYRRVTERSLQLSESAVKRQEQIGTLYRRVVLVCGLVLLGAIAVVLLFVLFSAEK